MFVSELYRQRKQLIQIPQSLLVDKDLGTLDSLCTRNCPCRKLKIKDDDFSIWSLNQFA